MFRRRRSFHKGGRKFRYVAHKSAPEELSDTESVEGYTALNELYISVRIYSTSAKLDYIEVPCGRCINCRINRTREWTMRLIQESDSWTNTIFVTLTYQDTALPVDSGLHKEDLQKFSSVSERFILRK